MEIKRHVYKPIFGRNFTRIGYPGGRISVLNVIAVESAIMGEIGETVQLSATVLPSNATNKAVTWSSDDEAVATVDSDGFVTMVSQDTCTITVETVDGGFTDTSGVTSFITNFNSEGWTSGEIDTQLIYLATLGISGYTIRLDETVGRTSASDAAIVILVTGGNDVIEPVATGIEHVANATNVGLSITELSCDVPAGTLDGQGMIAVVYSNVTSMTIDTPTGWVLVDSYSSSGTIYIFKRIADTEPSSYTFDGWSSTSIRITIITYKNIDIITFVGNTLLDRTLYNNMVVGGSVTATVDNEMLVFIVGVALNISTSISVVPAGMTALISTQDPVNYPTLICEQLIETAAATGSKTMTIADLAGTTWAMILLKPA